MFSYQTFCIASTGTNTSNNILTTTTALTTSNNIATTTTARTTTNYCHSMACGKNAICVTTSRSGYCNCINGYYGNPNSGGDCEQDLGNIRFIYPFSIIIGIPFDSDLLDPTSDNYQRFRFSLENAMLYIISSLLTNPSALLGVQLLNFQYCYLL